MVKVADAHLHAEVGVVVHEELLGHQLLQAVGVLRLRGPRVVLLEARRAAEVLVGLLRLGVYARARRIPDTLDARGTRGLRDLRREWGGGEAGGGAAVWRVGWRRGGGRRRGGGAAAGRRGGGWARAPRSRAQAAEPGAAEGGLCRIEWLALLGRVRAGGWRCKG
eukprot:scaffold51468_cov56-Phaeocystis_antarctica.AAC.3